MTAPTRTQTQRQPVSMAPSPSQADDLYPILPCNEDADWRGLMAGILAQAVRDSLIDPAAAEWLASDQAALMLEVIGLDTHPDKIKRNLVTRRELIPTRRRDRGYTPPCP